MPLILSHGSMVVVVLDDENILRVGASDPLIVDVGRIARDSGRSVEKLVVTYATPENQGEILRLGREGHANEAINLACRGFTTRTEGDGALVRITSAPVEQGN